MDPLTFLPLLLLLPISSALFSPADNFFLDCGSSTRSTSNNRVFEPDSDLPSTTRIHSPNPNPNLPSLYQTARIFTSPSSYTFHVTHRGPHLLRLHFHPFPSLLSSAHFHVITNDFVILFNFVPETSIKEFLIPVNSETLTLTFVPAGPTEIAFVNAIELFSAPNDLLADEALLVGPTPNQKFTGLTRHALETVHRVNVGGPTVTPFNDTLWRTWVPDTEFSISSSDSKIVATSARIAYRKYGASREVGPDNVYNSARVSAGSNMTWVFPVDPRKVERRWRNVRAMKVEGAVEVDEYGGEGRRRGAFGKVRGKTVIKI